MHYFKRFVHNPGRTNFISACGQVQDAIYMACLMGRIASTVKCFHKHNVIFIFVLFFP